MHNPLVTSANVDAKATYSNYDVQKGQWTNITIFPNTYSINSDNQLYNQLSGEFMISPWDLLVKKIIDEGFFSLDISDDNPKTVVEIDYLGDTNSIAFNYNTPGIDGTISILENIYMRLTGALNDVYYWVTDMSVVVMESYPEQYSVTTSIQMAQGLFSLVYNEEVTLIVSDYDIYAQYLVDPNGNITHGTKENYTLDVSGEIAEITFKTFSVGIDFRPEELFFFIVLENGMYLKSSPNGPLPVVGYSNMDISNYQVNIHQNDNSSKDDETTRGLKVPIFIFWVFIPLLAITLAQKQKRKM